LDKKQKVEIIQIVAPEKSDDILNEMGFNVLNARSLANGLSILANSEVHTTDISLVLLDHEYASKEQNDPMIVERFSSYKIPIILLLSTDDGELYGDALKKGVKDCIIKPLNFHHYEQLAQAVQAFQLTRRLSDIHSKSTTSLSAQDDENHVSVAKAQTNSKVSKSKFDMLNTQGHSLVGTPNFMAPELIRSIGEGKTKIKYGKAVDWYIYGIIANEYEYLLTSYLF
jgi:response regulator of citrate/malate metabolism